MTLWPLFVWDRCDDGQADDCLERWGHFLGACKRPFGRQSFGLWLNQELVSVATSASTVNSHCGPWQRSEVVELVRLCSAPTHSELTRPCLRLWRVTAGAEWARDYWPVVALVSYADATKHKGDIYRFDGWRKIKTVRGGAKKDSRNGNVTQTNPKTLWAFALNAGGNTP